MYFNLIPGIFKLFLLSNQSRVNISLTLITYYTVCF